MNYLLDTMVISYFFKVGRQMELAAAAKRVPLVLVDEVRGELAVEKKGGPSFAKWLGTSGIAVRSIAVGTPEFHTFQQLVPIGASGKDLGERASIALAAHDASLTFVTHDKNGMWLALRELWRPGDRVLGMAPFLRQLFEQNALTEPLVLDEIMTLVDASTKPTWWATWRAGLAAGATR